MAAIHTTCGSSLPAWRAQHRLLFHPSVRRAGHAGRPNLASRSLLPLAFSLLLFAANPTDQTGCSAAEFPYPSRMPGRHRELPRLASDVRGRHFGEPTGSFIVPGSVILSPTNPARDAGRYSRFQETRSAHVGCDFLAQKMSSTRGGRHFCLPQNPFAHATRDFLAQKMSFWHDERHFRLQKKAFLNA